MQFRLYRFSRTEDVDFAGTLKKRVNEYFNKAKVGRYSNANMVIKSIVMISLYAVPYLLMVTGLVTNIYLLWPMWILMGFGIAGIGFNVMHDALHGAFSRHKWLNQIMGYSLNVLGSNANLWKIQHNMLHHTFTNIEHADDDIKGPEIFLRFSPHQKKYWIHRFQHLYVWLFYGISTLWWVTAKDFTQIVTYRKRGLIKTKKAFYQELARIIGWKLLYYGYILVLPMILLPVAPWVVILMFVSMHFVTGIALSVVFQLAHVVPTSEYPVGAENGQMSSSRELHQLLTTANFAPKSRIFSWFVGGLNYQIEHHLFSNICHVHYPKISRIVKQTAKEFNMPYYEQPTFVAAVWNHIKMLRMLGRGKLVTGL